MNLLKIARILDANGNYLKTLGTMEQNGLLGKFPAMGFNQFQNIGRNIGQK